MKTRQARTISPAVPPAIAPIVPLKLSVGTILAVVGMPKQNEMEDGRVLNNY